MTAGRSPLYRKLAAAGVTARPVLEVTTARSGKVTDADIQSVKIRRGKSTPGGGTDPAIATVKLRSSYGLQFAGDVSIRLATAFASAVVAKTGGTASAIAPRFTGRMGPLRTNDLGQRLWDEFDASSWLVQASTAKWSVNLTAGMTIPAALLKLLDVPALRGKISLVYPGAWDNLAESIEGATWEDTASQLTSEIGVLLRPLRDGRNQLVSMPWRRDRALNYATTASAIGRRHALSPITWEQPTDAPGAVYRVRWVDADGQSRLSLAANGATGDTAGRVQDLDWRHIRFYTDQWQHMNALRLQQLPTRYRIPEITIDILHLFRLGDRWSLSLAYYLLVLESGDQVVLADDWYGTFPGIYWAEGIEEEITPDSWTITLQLVAWPHVTGTADPPPPDPTYWGQAVFPWRNAAQAWKDY